MDPVIISAVVATAGTVATGLGLAWLGRKWGLPGIGREVQTQQAALIATLQGELSELRTQLASDDAKITQLEATVRSQTEEIEKQDRKIQKQQRELLDLYRLTGKQVPAAW